MLAEERKSRLKVLFLIDQGGRFDAVTFELKLESRDTPSRGGSRCRGLEAGVGIVRVK